MHFFHDELFNSGVIVCPPDTRGYPPQERARRARQTCHARTDLLNVLVSQITYSTERPLPAPFPPGGGDYQVDCNLLND